MLQALVPSHVRGEALWRVLTAEVAENPVCAVTGADEVCQHGRRSADTGPDGSAQTLLHEDPAALIAVVDDDLVHEHVHDSPTAAGASRRVRPHPDLPRGTRM